MRDFTVCLPLLLMVASALANDKPTEEKTVVDSGSFGIYMNGKRIGTEKFSIEQQADEGVVMADVDIEDGDSKSEQKSELRVARDGSLHIYKWNSILPTQEESVVKPKGEFLTEHVTTADKKRDVPHILPHSTAILDDNFFSQRELLVWRYLATGCVQKGGQLLCGPAHFGILIPHRHAAGNTVVELVGRDRINVKGEEKELNKVKMDIDGVQWLIWVDDGENGYKVIKMAIPSSNVEVVRD